MRDCTFPGRSRGANGLTYGGHRCLMLQAQVAMVSLDTGKELWHILVFGKRAKHANEDIWWKSSIYVAGYLMSWTDISQMTCLAVPHSSG